MLFTAKLEVKNDSIWACGFFGIFLFIGSQKKVDRCEHKEEKDNEEEAGNDVEEEVLM